MTWEVIAAFSSTLIALCAFVLTFWQAYISRQHNKLSVTPHLTTWSHKNQKENQYIVELCNNGIGPALIESFGIHVDGQLIAGKGQDPIENTLRILFPQYHYDSTQSYLAKGYMMAAEESRNVVSIKFHGERVPTIDEIENAGKRVRLLIDYQSIYKDKFVLDTSAFSANSVPQKAT